MPLSRTCHQLRVARAAMCACLFICFAFNSLAAQSLDRLTQELRFIPDNAFAVLIFRSDKMLDIPGIEDLGPFESALAKDIGLGDAREIVAAVLPGQHEAEFLFHIRFKQPAPVERIRKVIAPTAKKVEAPFPAFDGEGINGYSLAFPEPNHVLIAKDFNAIKNGFLAGRIAAEPKPKIKRLLNDKGVQIPLVFAIDLERMQHYEFFVSGPRLYPGHYSEFWPNLEKNISLIRGRMTYDKNLVLSADIINSGNLEICKSDVSSRLNELTSNAPHSYERLEKFAPSKSIDRFRKFIAGLGLSDRKDFLQIKSNSEVERLELWAQLKSGAELYRLANEASLKTLRTSNKTRQIVIANHNYFAAKRKFATNILDHAGKPLLSWRVVILPFIGQRALYNEFKLDEPWDSEHNKKLLGRMPEIFQSIYEKSNSETSYLIPVMSKGLRREDVKQFEDIKDGAGATIFILESQISVPWTKPQDHDVDLSSPSKNLAGEFVASFFDGGTKTISQKRVSGKLASLFTLAANDGEKRKAPVPQKPSQKHSLARDFFKRHFPNLEPSDEICKLVEQRDFLHDLESAEAQEFASKLVGSSDPYEIGLGLVIFGCLKPSYDWKKLSPHLNSRFDMIRSAARRLVLRTKKPGMVAIVFESNPEAFVHALDFGDFFQMREEDAREHVLNEIIPYLKHENPKMRIQAVSVVARFGGKKYRGHVEQLLNDDVEEVREAVSEYSKQMGFNEKR